LNAKTEAIENVGLENAVPKCRVENARPTKYEKPKNTRRIVRIHI